MKKLIVVGLVICLLVSAFVGCAKETTTPTSASAPASTPALTPGEKPTPVIKTRTVVDDRGKAVEIPAKVNRVVTICIPYAQIVWALDPSGGRLVGMHESAKVAVKNSILGRMAPELLNVESGFTGLGSFAVNVEELLKLEPDVVFQWTSEAKEIEKMEAAGITVIAVVSLPGHDEVPHRLKLVGEVLGKEQRAAELIDDYRQTVGIVSSKTSKLPPESKPLILHLSGIKQLNVGYYPQYEIAGARSAASSSINVNMEQILKWDPEIIYIGNFCTEMPVDLIENKVAGQDWSQIKAVKNRKVYKVPMGTYRWDPWNAESALGVWWVAKVQHPDLFADYTIEEKIRGFYSRFYNYNLSNEEIEWILHPIAHKGR